MDATALEPFRRAALRPWVIILATLPFVAAGFALLGYHWQSQRQDLARLTDQYVQRQNQVLAQDAMKVARAVSDLLGRAARDAEVLSTLPHDPAVFARYFAVLKEGRGPGPLYSRMGVFKRGTDLLWYEAGKKAPQRLALPECETARLCDRGSLQAAMNIPEGKALVGKGLRWYTPKDTPKDFPDEGFLSVVYRSATGIYLVGIDYKSFTPIVRLPTFPYQERGELLQDYQDGNYIYLLDRDSDLLAHPRRWHLNGIDRETGLAVPPMRTDADAGTHPLNFRAYERGKLRPYFDRLLAHSFQGAEVDVFEAENLSGLVRVISVAPVFLSDALFDQKGPFGYVGVGCALEHFQEPEQRLVPYY